MYTCWFHFLIIPIVFRWLPLKFGMVFWIPKRDCLNKEALSVGQCPSRSLLLRLKEKNFFQPEENKKKIQTKLSWPLAIDSGREKGKMFHISMRCLLVRPFVLVTINWCGMVLALVWNKIIKLSMNNVRMSPLSYTISLSLANYTSLNCKKNDESRKKKICDFFNK